MHVSRVILLCIPFGLAWLAGCAGSGGMSTPHLYRGPHPDRPGSAQAEIRVRSAYADLESARAAHVQGERRRAAQLLAKVRDRLSNQLIADPHSRETAVALGVAYFYEGYLGDRSGYGRCVEFLTHVLEVDPYAAHAARYLAHAYEQMGDTESAHYYADYVQAVSADSNLLAEMGALLRPYDEAFLTNWNTYLDFYQSPEARLVRFNPQTFQQEVLVQITPEFELQLAAQALRRLQPELPLSSDEAARSYLQRLVDRLVAASPGPPFAYRVDLVESTEPNAMVVPGHIYVNRGLLSMVENEAELVAVLSHELAHVYAHHGARKLIADVTNRELATSLLSMVRVRDDLQRQLLQLGSDVVLDLILRGYNRRQESEADRLGMHIAFNAGYNPTFMASTFLRLYELNPHHPPRLLATHPPTTERIEEVTAYVGRFPLDREMRIDSPEFQSVRQAAARR